MFQFKACRESVKMISGGRVDVSRRHPKQRVAGHPGRSTSAFWGKHRRKMPREEKTFCRLCRHQDRQFVMIFTRRCS